jgi:hypothetical protein
MTLSLGRLYDSVPLCTSRLGNHGERSAYCTAYSRSQSSRETPA